MEGALSNPTRWAGTRQGRLEGEEGEGKCLTRFRQLSLRHLPSAKKQNPPTQPAGRDPERRAYRGPRRARERGEHRAPRTPGGDQPAGLPRRSRRPHARTPARPHVADQPRPLTVAPGSFPRSGPQRLPQSEHHPAAGHV